METFSALLVICTGNSPVPGEFPSQRPVTLSFDVFFDLRLNKRLSKQPGGRWFKTLSRPLWRHRNDRINHSLYKVVSIILLSENMVTKISLSNVEEITSLSMLKTVVKANWNETWIKLQQFIDYVFDNKDFFTWSCRIQSSKISASCDVWLARNCISNLVLTCHV